MTVEVDGGVEREGCGGEEEETTARGEGLAVVSHHCTFEASTSFGALSRGGVGEF